MTWRPDFDPCFSYTSPSSSSCQLILSRYFTHSRCQTRSVLWTFFPVTFYCNRCPKLGQSEFWSVQDVRCTLGDIPHDAIWQILSGRGIGKAGCRSARPTWWSIRVEARRYRWDCSTHSRRAIPGFDLLLAYYEWCNASGDGSVRLCLGFLFLTNLSGSAVSKIFHWTMLTSNSTIINSPEKNVFMINMLGT